MLSAPADMKLLAEKERWRRTPDGLYVRKLIDQKHKELT